MAVAVQEQDGSYILATVALIRRAPNCNQRVFGEHELVPLHHKLVGTCDELNVIGVVEMFGGLPSEHLPRTSRTLGPCLDVGVLRIRPHDVAEWP